MLKAIFFYLVISRTQQSPVFSPFFCTKMKSLKKLSKLMPTLVPFYWFWMLIIPFFSGTQFTGAVAWFNANPWPKSTLRKKTCFYQLQQNLSLLREFFCKTTPPKKHYYYIHTTRINKQLRKQQNKDGKNEEKYKAQVFPPPPLFSRIFFTAQWDDLLIFV